MAGNDFNHITVTGRLGGDPESRFTPNGDAITTFSLANGQYDRQAEGNELTTWYRVTMFGKRAEAANNYLSKGARVLVSGSHRIRVWVDKEGNKRESNEIIANDFTFMDSKASAQGAPAAEAAPARPASKAPASRPTRNVPQAIDYSEDLPF